LKEIPLLDYAHHTRECEKATPKSAPEAPEPVNRANGSQPAPRGLVYALFDPKAVGRLERAGAEIACLRQQLRTEHETTTAVVRVQRCREIARQECAQMVVVVEQLRRRFRLQGSGSVFIPGLHPLVVEDHLHEAQNELVRMSSPAVWRWRAGRSCFSITPTR
jgi:hypothetical protein